MMQIAYTWNCSKFIIRIELENFATCIANTSDFSLLLLLFRVLFIIKFFVGFIIDLIKTVTYFIFNFATSGNFSSMHRHDNIKTLPENKPSQDFSKAQ